MSISYGFRRAGSAVAAFAAGLALCGSAPAAEPAHAKNVILFIGDGMGVSTLTAARIYQGQLRGADGASNRLSFERFPNLALVKTYSADSLVTDSANGASAMMTGVRTINGALGVDASVDRDSCASALAARVETVAELAKARGLSTGAVSTAAITDATPAALYAHTGARSWQGDFVIPPEAAAAGCIDIARQLVEAPEAVRLDLALGGGAEFFKAAKRRDGRDLTHEWAGRPGSVFVDTAQALVALPNGTRRVLGLFASNNMRRETDRPSDAPRLADMTKSAISFLSQNPKGYFLMVEGGLIDKAHHVGLAHEALNETVEFDAAIVQALAMTDPRNTLILVTADHSHGLTISGGARNSPILGLVPDADGKPKLAADGKPYGILNYETGPGAPGAGETRFDPATKDTLDPAYVAQAAIPMSSAAHTGEDVALYAQGPGAERVHGLIDQPDIFEIMRLALGLPAPKRPARP
ncbi:alkaline phosphatase [Phenylobacterium sp. 20VBR1]|uniref:Alkaline phosphatase n=1 Tax=Phenylobacterium glaciei TaxID=2803784 RepID=A0A941D2R4_9CAUL|nr:alkaline phosphatase [Phenylobacterium glaciei]